jgi:hypothetical protein
MVAVIGRFYARIFIRKWVGVDDGMCVLALVSRTRILEAKLMKANRHGQIFTLATTVVVVLANERFGWSR